MEFWRGTGSEACLRSTERRCKSLIVIRMVGERGFEPPTPWSRTRCSTRLSHSPNDKAKNCSRSLGTINALQAGCEISARSSSGSDRREPKHQTHRSVNLDSSSILPQFRRLHARLGQSRAVPPIRLDELCSRSPVPYLHSAVIALRARWSHKALSRVPPPVAHQPTSPSSQSPPPSARPRFPPPFHAMAASPRARSPAPLH